MMNRFRANTLVLVFAALAWIASPVYNIFEFIGAEAAPNTIEPCPSGRAAARLTGWMLNEKMPVGKANYNEKSQKLDVAVESVALPDGRKLNVLIGDDRVGELGSLTNGSATGAITRNIKEGSRVRVLDGERPIVSGNLVCDNAEPAPTVPPSPSPTPSPTETPTPDPSVTPTPSPSPTLSPEH